MTLRCSTRGGGGGGDVSLANGSSTGRIFVLASLLSPMPEQARAANTSVTAANGLIENPTYWNPPVTALSIEVCKKYRPEGNRCRLRLAAFAGPRRKSDIKHCFTM